MTTKKIINMLPFDEEFKVSLAQGFDSLTKDQKYELEELLWDTYDLFYEWKLQEKMSIALDDVQKSHKLPNKELYALIREATEKELEETGIQSTEKIDLSQTRTAIEELLQQKN